MIAGCWINVYGASVVAPPLWRIAPAATATTAAPGGVKELVVVATQKRKQRRAAEDAVN